MIITKAKHDNIVSMKDADIKVLKNKNRSMQNSLVDNLEEINQLKEEMKLLNTEINMKNETILHRTQELTEVRNSLVEARKEVKKLTKYIEHKNECMAEDTDFIKCIVADNTRLEKEIEYINEIKRQIQECISIGIKAKWVTGTITKQEARKLLNRKNLDLLVDLYSSANML